MQVTLNRYIVRDRLIAGEYPSSSDSAQARAKLDVALSDGTTLFIDLTHPHELAHYHPMLEGTDVRYKRLPIVDGSVPTDPETVLQALALIDEEIQQGGRPYVHCWGGIGRTGLIVGCWLVSQGSTGDEALEEVQRLYATTPKVTRRPESPENDLQRAYVRRWAKM
jgi:protein-tyrosine phosphatase